MNTDWEGRNKTVFTGIIVCIEKSQRIYKIRRKEGRKEGRNGGREGLKFIVSSFLPQDTKSMYYYQFINIRNKSLEFKIKNKFAI
jgi:hypothetical protein